MDRQNVWDGSTGTYLERFNSALKLGDSSSNHNDMSAFTGELDRESTTHAIRATSDHDSLEERGSAT
jgi:hypothetical protein